jgi:hypothetical protein
MDTRPAPQEKHKLFGSSKTCVLPDGGTAQAKQVPKGHSFRSGETLPRSDTRPALAEQRRGSNLKVKYLII